MNSRDDIWKESLMELALLQIELEEKGGPSEDGNLFEHLLSCEKKLLKTFGLPDSIDFLKIISFENVPGEIEITNRLEQLKEAATNYLLTDAKSEVNILQNAKAKQLDPFNVLPELNIRIHIYTIFIYDKILLREEDTVENVWHELQLTRDPEVLDYTGKLGLKEYDFEEHIDYRKMLQNKGLKYLDHFINTQEHFLSDNDY
jgi:hypothetical protein